MTTPDSTARSDSALGGHTPGSVEILLANLNDRQRAFIVKMKPVLTSQIISAADFEAVDPCIDLHGDVWPKTYWFGGMRLSWPAGRARRTFCFNEDGLEVRAALSKPTPQNHLQHKG
ncbi:hypothetical protein L7H23_01340 [Sphingopyxis sp. BSN-002]|uniref:hypothetical protein n=1 Tax=Sphingopyxis sp. BSN-002 TaxID=2911495 RepID=UPI001EDA93F4|nr:hypothetical protein [Sphingopyxis sp. BSN-002]QVJ07681.1 hypothetical protein [Sphingopyxis phage VSN-002]UKK84777.1 hypothetical protein L7H23_01340 [Sphingopyxis sp. BSN-002]